MTSLVSTTCLNLKARFLAVTNFASWKNNVTPILTPDQKDFVELLLSSTAHVSVWSLHADEPALTAFHP